MKFTAHIPRKLMTANQQLGIIKRALLLYWALTNAKLFAYKTLCLPHLEYYAAAAWDPSSKKDISDIVVSRTTPRPSSAIYSSWNQG